MKRRDDIYYSKNKNDLPSGFNILGNSYEKVFDLRYGTNPHQKSSYYQPVNKINCIMGDMKILKEGKNGLSQTNLEDIHYAIRILKYMTSSTVVIMKHGNPCGVAMQSDKNESAISIFKKALNCDPRASFGGVIVCNFKIDSLIAKEIMSIFFEIVVAIDYDSESLDIFSDYSTYKKNKEIRILKIDSMESISKYVQDSSDHFEIKSFEDGSLIISEFLLSKIETYKQLQLAKCNHCNLISTKSLSKNDLQELLFAWRINFSVRSNGIVITKNYQTLAIGTGEQDRIGSIEKAISKVSKYKGNESLKGSYLSSDGFIPFSDSIKLIAENGIEFIIQPGGSIRDCEVIKTANECEIGMVFTKERIFSHH